MLHFIAQGAGRHLIWGSRSDLFAQPPEVELRQLQESRTNTALTLAIRQGEGAIGFYRTEENQPRLNVVNGEYDFDTYVTAFNYAQGQYSFALAVEVSLSETLNVSDSTSTATGVYGAALVEALNMSDTVTPVRVLNTDLSEDLALSDSYTFVGIYGVLLPESLLLEDALSINEALVAYAVNTNTGALSEYSNFNFNSLTKFNGRFYGATDEGIFELAGDTDDGVEIDASVLFGTTDLSTDEVLSENMKRLPAVYLGLSTAGDMILTVTTPAGGANAYTLTPATATSLHTGRMLLGKGVVSRYWDFELTNVSGADFTLESVSLTPIVVKRRINEG